MYKNHRAHVTLFSTVSLLSALLISGCSSIVINDNDRTSSKAFDGLWLGSIDSKESMQMSGKQSVNDRIFSCDALRVEFRSTVSNGVISAKVNLNSTVSFSSNIDSSGRFYAEIPKESSYLINGRSRFGAHEYHVFNGTLSADNNNGNGLYIVAFGSVSQGGCQYQLQFTRDNGAL